MNKNMNILKCFAFSACIVLSWPTLAETLKACKLNEDYVPISFPDRVAPGEKLISMAVQKLGHQVEFNAAPWPRCLDGVRKGQYDLLVGPSPNPKFFDFVAYPMKAGKPDLARSLWPVEYRVLRTKGSQTGWDGERCTGLTTPVVYGNTAVIVKARLDKMGIPSDDSARQIEQLSDMLYHGRTDAVIMRYYEAQSLIASPRYHGKLEMLPRPFVAFDAYLGMSKQFEASHHALALSIWNELGKIRSSHEAAELMRSLLSGNN